MEELERTDSVNNEMVEQSELQNESQNGKSGFLNSVSKVGKKGVKTVWTGIKNIGSKVDNVINNVTTSHENKKILNHNFEKEAQLFTFYMKDGKKQEIYCLYDGEQKTLKVRENIQPNNIIKLQDEKKQLYFIEHVDLNKVEYKVIHNDQILKMVLEVIHFTNKEDAPQVVNNNYNIENSNISGAVGNNNNVGKKTKLGIDFNLFKKG